ncbi:MAG: hypothetical protein WCI75_19395 [candidate division NC10 bacterium]
MVRFKEEAQQRIRHDLKITLDALRFGPGLAAQPRIVEDLSVGLRGC